MANFSDIKYIRSSVNFTYISSVKDIKTTGKINIKWNLVLKNKEDLESLYLVRAVLFDKEKADLGSSNILNKFRTIYSWKRGESGGEPVSEFTDVFAWDDNTENNLHNLNVTNDASWTEKKFNDTLRKIASGEQGVIYKIYGYSRRMSRAATPIGFFCDGNNIVALSQRNQVINDKWHNECGVVWKAGSTILGGSEKFVRVAVDMNRDIGETPKKCRRVWATTNAGRVVLFDYWTGRVIWHKVVSKNIPIYAMAYDANNNLFVYYDGNSNVVSMKEDLNSGSVIVVKTAGPFGDFKSGAAFAKRVMGAVCVAERSDTGAFLGTYFYVITNRETVVKFKITANNITKSGVIPRTHFGCTSKFGDLTQDSTASVLGETPANQNNIYGIGAGANGQVWVNGHTPITVVSYNIKASGNPVKVKVRLGRGVKYWKKNQVPVLDATNGTHGCAQLWDHRDANVWWEKVKEADNVNRNGIHKSKDAEWYVSKLNTAESNFGQPCIGSKTQNTDVVSHTWNYSAWMFGAQRPDKSHASCQVGCKIGIHKIYGLAWINAMLNTWNCHGEKIDQRKLGKGTAITLDSFAWLDMPMEGGLPASEPDVINRIHLELVSVEDGDGFSYVDKSFMQDLNYVYGCVNGENYNDTNGRIEELENVNGDSPNYRRTISGTPDNSNKWFSSMTKWLPYSAQYEKQFGFAGIPFIYDTNSKSYDSDSTNIKTKDKHVGKPNVFDVRSESANKGRYRNVYNADENNKVDVSQYNDYLPMSIGSIYPRLPSDGRLFISKANAHAYKVGSETNALSYEIMFADRREGKIGFLNYNRPSATNADTSYPTADNGNRVSYTSNTSTSIKSADTAREYYCAEGTSKKAFLDDAPYHVVVDSDNNPWFASQTYIGKIQMLNVNNGRQDKYTYNVSAGSGLFAFENNNKLFESSLVLLEKHARNGAYCSSGSLFPNGIKNSENGYNEKTYQTGQELIDAGIFNLASNSSSNLAYVYNYEPWKQVSSGDGRPWHINNVFGNGVAVWKKAYTKTGSYTSHTGNDLPYDGNLENEFNSDNFGLNCLNQLNRVELGPDYIHPKILKPTAKSKVIEAFSKSNNDGCDTVDGSGFWNEHTSIFNNAQTVSGYDDLSTTHYIYDIENNYRTLSYHRYNYHDQSVIGKDSDGYISRRHPFEKDEDQNLINLENVIDNSFDVVWHTPNYAALIPPYDPLSVLSAEDAHAKTNQYWVDLYIDYVPAVYNLFSKEEENQYEYIKVGHHDVHIFERWPTPDYCVKGIGNTESVDKTTEYNLVGTYYWGECVNDRRN